jgi:hypothetical protein
MSLLVLCGRCGNFIRISLIGATTLVLAYGLNIKLVNDPFIHLADDSMRPLIEAIVPGAFLVDLIPALQYIPAWFPGAGFQRKAREWKKMTMVFRNTPFNAAKKAIVSTILYGRR